MAKFGMETRCDHAQNMSIGVVVTKIMTFLYNCAHVGLQICLQLAGCNDRAINRVTINSTALAARLAACRAATVTWEASLYI